MEKVFWRHLLFALLGAVIAITSLIALQRGSLQTASPHIESLAVDVVFCGGCFIGPQFLKITPKFSVPDEAKIGEAFLVEAFFEVTDSLGEDLRYQVLSNLSATLNLAGAEVAPSAPQSVGADAEIRWSVTLREPGEHLGFIALRETQPGGLSGGRVVSEEGKVAIIAVSTRNIIPVLQIFGLFSGLILMILRLCRFYWDWLDRKREHEKRKNKERSNLILPD